MVTDIQLRMYISKSAFIFFNLKVENKWIYHEICINKPILYFQWFQFSCKI